jgi:hypothetical protein
MPIHKPLAPRSHCGHKGQAAADRRRFIKSAQLRRVVQQADPRCPFHRGAGVVNTAFDGIAGFRGGLPRNRGCQPAGTGRGPIAGQCQRKSSGAEGDFCLACMPAAMAKQGRLLIDDRGEHRRSVDVAERAGGGTDRRQAFDRHPKNVAKRLVPAAACDVHEAGA